MKLINNSSKLLSLFNSKLYENKLQRLTDKINSLTNEISHIKQTKKGDETAILRSTLGIQTCEDEILLNLKISNDELHSLINEKDTKISELSDKIDQIFDFSIERNDLKDKIDHIEGILYEKLKENNELRSKLEEAATEKEKLFDSTQRQLVEKFDIRNQLDELQEKIKEMKETLHNVNNREKERKLAILGYFKAQNNQLKNENLKMKEKLNQRSSQHQETIVFKQYMKKVLMQFFIQDDSKRTELIPVLLQMCGANEHEIQTSKCQWERSLQFISKAAGLFGF
ncbi:hypothetical protein TRFO_26038 [Tritrichomonas foetus]|uniref:GRIP domain-containing protein n=1 Tax=Tritrichomonas foetus TaxID=1144522 RepID=A0A1J4K965_9EUKA|nr:hypothetical protein TRFO_26038 [Tritrichomonas foetus]|eukprot:OHT05981.1 hypothetical protein TRFO_26038 [Tritrichomonas foetus]